MHSSLGTKESSGGEGIDVLSLEVSGWMPIFPSGLGMDADTSWWSMDGIFEYFQVPLNSLKTAIWGFRPMARATWA